MANYQLKALPRTATGSAAAKEMRRERLVPANVYGHKKTNALVSVESGDMEKALASGEPLISLAIGSEERIVIVKEVQKDPVKGVLVHVDFYEVSMDRAIDTTVPIVITGHADSEAGVVTQNLRELSISCLPGAIPENFSVDITGFSIGHSVQVADLDVPQGVTVTNEPDEVIVSIAAPAAVEVEAEEVDGELDETDEGDGGEGDETQGAGGDSDAN